MLDKSFSFVLCCTLKVWCNALYLLHKQINSHESRFNVFGLFTNSTAYMSFGESWARTRDVQVTEPTLSLYTTHVLCCTSPTIIFALLFNVYNFDNYIYYHAMFLPISSFQYS